MSLDHLAEQIGSLRDQASLAKNTLAMDIKAAEADTTLSPEGRRQIMEELGTETSTKLAALRAEETRLTDERITQLSRSLSGSIGVNSSDHIAMRDAQDRADRLETAEEAATAIDRAILNDDVSLAYAILRRAAGSGWTETVQRAREAYPKAGEALSDLLELSRHLNDSNQRLIRSMTYSG